jgi:ABC-type proline/glycine betaine transport system permease subunit
MPSLLSIILIIPIILTSLMGVFYVFSSRHLICRTINWGIFGGNTGRHPREYALEFLCTGAIPIAVIGVLISLIYVYFKKMEKRENREKGL